MAPPLCVHHLQTCSLLLCSGVMNQSEMAPSVSPSEKQ